MPIERGNEKLLWTIKISLQRYKGRETPTIFFSSWIFLPFVNLNILPYLISSSFDYVFLREWNSTYVVQDWTDCIIVGRMGGKSPRENTRNQFNISQCVFVSVFQFFFVCLFVFWSNLFRVFLDSFASLESGKK